jgi:putative ABC transport system permease protein
MTIANIKPSWRKLFSDLWGNKMRTLLVVASIAVGVFAVGMIGGAYFIIPQDMNSSYSRANPANVVIKTRSFDKDFLKTIEKVDGVQQAGATRTVTVRMDMGSDRWKSLDLIALSDFSAQRIDSQIYVSGARAPAKDQVILDKRTATKNGFKTGDKIQIELSDGTLRDLLVAGIAQDVTSGVSGMMSNDRGYIIEDSLEWLHTSRSYDKLLVTVKGDRNDLKMIEQVRDRLINKMEDAGYTVTSKDTHPQNKHPMESILQALLSILMVLGVLIVFLGGSLISNTLSSLLTQHLPQIGIMKLVGARRAQIIRIYLTLILAFGMMALMLAVPTGSWAAYELSAFAASMVGFPLSAFHLVPQALIIQAVIALAVPLFAGAPAVMQGAGVTVQKAITGGGIGGGSLKRKSLLDRALGRIRGISRLFLVSIRNTFRHKARLALTLFTLTLGGAIFISVFNVQVSLNNQINEITKYFGADVNLNFSRLYSIEEVNSSLKEIPEVERVEAWTASDADLLNPDGSVAYSITLMAPPAETQMVKPILLQGRWIMPGDENAITVNEAFLRKFPNLKVGDRLRLKVGERKQDWMVVGIFQFTGTDEMIAYTGYEYLSGILNQNGHAAMFRVAATDHSLNTQTHLSETLDRYFRDLGYQVSETEAGGAFTKSMTDYITILTGFLVIMALLTAIVGSIGMAGTLSMNVMERTREIGVLRAIGAYNQVIMRLVLVEGLIIGLISFTFGSVLSFPISSILSELISQAIFNSPARNAFTVQGFAIWLAVVVVLSVLASLVPARSATKMTIREVLAYE